MHRFEIPEYIFTALELLETLDKGPFILVDESMRVVWMSAAMEGITGSRREDLIGTHLAALSSPILTGWAATVCRQIQRGDEEFHAASGADACHNLSWRLIELAPDCPYRLIRLREEPREKGAKTDEPTRRLQIPASTTEDAGLRQADDYLRILETAMSTAKSGIVITDLAGRIVYVNRALLDMGGYSEPGELIGKDGLHYWFDSEQKTAAIRELHERGEWFGELRGRTKNGEPMDVQIAVHRVTDETGSPLCVLSSCIDVTEQRRMAEALSESERLYRTLTESAPDVIFQITTTGNVLYVNGYGAAWLQTEPARLIGKHIREIFPPEVAELWMQKVEQVAASGRPVTDEIRLPLPGGEIWIDTRLIPVPGKNGAIRSLMGISRDITGRKKNEEQLRFQAQVLSQMGDAVVAIDSDGRITYFNTAAERLYGIPATEAIGKYRRDIIAYEWPSPENEKTAWQSLNDSGSWRGTVIHRKKNGEAIFVDAAVRTIRGEHGEITGRFGVIRDITQQRLAEEELRIKDMAIAASQDGIALVDLAGNITYVNQATLDILGYSTLDEVVGNPISLFWADVQSHVLRVAESMKERGSWTGETEARRKDGSTFPIQLSITLVTDKSGRPLCTMGSAIDMSERKRAEEALVRSEREKALILDSTGELFVYFDTDLRIRWANRAATESTGLPVEDLIGARCYEIWHHRSEPCEFCPVREVLATGEPTAGEISTPDGRVWRVRSQPMIDEAGKTTGVIVFGTDVSEQKRMEDALYAAISYTRGLIETSLDSLVTISPDGRITDVNSATEAVIGYPREVLIGSDFSDYFTEPETARQGYRQAFEAGEVRDYALELRHRSGRTIPVLYNASVYRNRDGEVAGVFAAARDITDLKRAERALRNQASLLNLTHDTIIVRDMGNRIVFWNWGAEEQYGWRSDEVLGAHIHHLLKTEFPTRQAEIESQLIREGRWEGELVHTRRDGSTFVVASRWALLRGPDGRPETILETNNDITERKNAEAIVQSRVNRQAAIAKLGLTALSGGDLGHLLDEAVRTIAELLGAEYCKVLRLLPNGREFLLQAGVGWEDGLVGSARVEAGSSQAGYTLRSNEPVIVEDFSTETRFTRPEILRRHGIQSGISVVIYGRDAPYGILGVHTSEPHRFTGADVYLVQAIANTLSQGIERRQAEEDLEKRNRHLSALNRIIGTTVASTDPEEMLKAVLGTTVDLLDLTGGGIYLTDPENSRARLIHTQNLPTGFPTTTCIGNIRHEPYRTVLIEGKTLFFDAEPFRYPGDPEGQKYPAASIPLVTHTGVLGAINVIGRAGGPFTEDEQFILTQIGREIGTAVERLFLNSQLEAAHREANLYLDILTHDIRNAENVATLYTDLLSDMLDGKAAEYAGKLRSTIRKSIDILVNVSTIRKIHEKAAPLNPIPLERIIAGEREHFPEAFVTVDCPGSCVVLADDLLSEVFTNLIGNAVKFGGSEVAITITAEEQEDEVIVTVADTGPGVPDEIKEEVFRRFERGKQKGRGEGLGLFIVKMLIERYGGRIWIEDRVSGRSEEGAAFRFTLHRASPFAGNRRE